MNRRKFHQTLAGAALAAAAGPALSAMGAQDPSAGEADGAIKFSVMLWTVFRELPFEERLEKMAQAGYHSVELVNEFEKWTDGDYQKALNKKKSLGLGFDTLVANPDYARRPVTLVSPAHREGFLADVRGSLKIAQRLECPTLIVMSGNNQPGLSHAAQHESVVEGLKRAADIVKSDPGKISHGRKRRTSCKYPCKSPCATWRARTPWTRASATRPRSSRSSTRT